MIRKFRVLLPLIIIVTGFITNSQINLGQAFLDTSWEGSCICIINDEFVSNSTIPPIDLKSFSNNATSSEIKLEFFGTPILNNSSYGYRIVITWSGTINFSSIRHWPDRFNWEKSVYPEQSFTQCYAGGASGFGVVNGSYSEFYDSSGNLIFSETKNNSVLLQNDTLIFPVNQSLVGSTPPNGNTPLDSKNQFLAFTTFNTTKTETFANGTTTIMNATWIDSISWYFMVNMFQLITLENRFRIGIFISIFGLIGASQVIFSKRKRK